MQQRGLPTAGRPHDGNELALFDGEVNTDESVDGVFAELIALAKRTASRTGIPGSRLRRRDDPLLCVFVIHTTPFRPRRSPHRHDPGSPSLADAEPRTACLLLECFCVHVEARRVEQAQPGRSVAEITVRETLAPPDQAEIAGRQRSGLPDSTNSTEPEMT